MAKFRSLHGKEQFKMVRAENQNAPLILSLTEHEELRRELFADFFRAYPVLGERSIHRRKRSS